MATTKRSRSAPVHVALLRGINLGNKNKLPMKELVLLVEDLGCQSVRHYIQSGNLVFRAKSTLVRRLDRLLSEAIRERFGYDVPVVLRSAAQLEAVVENNPFLGKTHDQARLHVAFLAAQPSPACVKQLDPKRSPPDAFAVVGREIFLHLPNGVARSKFTNAYFDSKLETVSTVRNWRTVLTLLDMVHATT